MSSPSGSGPPQRSICPVANALDVVGDRWTLLVMRDLVLFGKRRFGELAACEERIPTNVLADRLRRLEAGGLIVKQPYQDHPRRYEYRPTPRGADLVDVLVAMIEWASRHLPGAAQPPPGFLEQARATARLNASGATARSA